MDSKGEDSIPPTTPFSRGCQGRKKKMHGNFYRSEARIITTATITIWKISVEEAAKAMPIMCKSRIRTRFEDVTYPETGRSGRLNASASEQPT